MKKIITLLLPTLLVTTSISMVQIEKNKLKENNNLIWNINVSDNQTFDVSNNNVKRDAYIKNMPVTFNFLQYSNNWNEFIQKYPHFIFTDSNQITASVYQNSKTYNFNETYNTNNLSGKQGLLLGRPNVSFGNGEVTFQSCYIEALIQEYNNKIYFYIDFLVDSQVFYFNPSYSANISQIEFLSI